MPRDHLPRKLTVRAGGRTLVLLKRPEESGEHVIQKAVLWAHYLPAYPALRVEQRLPWPSRYKPDLYALDATGQTATFWGECGVVSAAKLREVVRAYPHTHFVFSKWDARVDPFAALIDDALRGLRRTAPLELVRVPGDAGEWIDAGRDVEIPADALEIRRWPAQRR